MSENRKTEPTRVVPGRGKAYPFISLRKAVERAEQLRKANMARVVASPLAFYKVWNFRGDNGNARQTLAAMRSFGLLENSGSASKREVCLSDLGRNLVLDKVPSSIARAAALRTAALSPPIHQRLWHKFGNDLPADVVIETFLLQDCGFDEGAARNLIEEYRSTFEYAGLSEVGRDTPFQAATSPDVRLPNAGKVGVDEAVQSASSGTDFAPQDPPSEQPTRETDDPSQAPAVAKGRFSSAPFEEFGAEAQGRFVTESARQRMPHQSAGQAGGTATAAGERELIRGPLSRDVSYRLMVRGDLGPRELGKLITLLSAQRAVLSDDAGGDAP